MKQTTRRWIVATTALLSAGVAVPAAAAQFHRLAQSNRPLDGATPGTNNRSVATADLHKQATDLVNQEQTLSNQIKQLQDNLQAASQYDKQLASTHDVLQSQVISLVKQAETVQTAQQVAVRTSTQPKVQVASRASGHGSGDDGSGDGRSGDDD
ncbi:hypothetical protein JZ785_26275 [Alicyclobacillus curvatus]|nr:hypothetical protein JZ785_26275 [Alicyclobacillus curvatus]